MMKLATVLAFVALALVLGVVVLTLAYQTGSPCDDCWKHLEDHANGDGAPVDLGWPATREPAG